MIISEQWLRSWVNPALTTEELAHQLTMAGLEVDAVTPVAGQFSGVVVAEILSAEQHPDADKLRVCQVAVGDETVQIVCGAPNARAGLKAPLARVGAVLPGDFKIKKAKLRGVESQGMLCAEAELQLSEANAGLMELASDAPVGTDLREYLGLDDVTIEIGLTPNRADCLGIRGIARDVAALNSLAICEPELAPVPAVIADEFPIVIDAPEKCPRYLGRVIKGVDLTRPSPLFITERLRRAGLRPIDAVVDVTNYVMLELGQPLHAFDLDTLSGGIVVRESKPSEQMTLLDGSDISLSQGSLLIADHERPLALAGIMGGEQSGVSAATTHIFLESAFFAPEPMAGRARGYGLHTDASHRYERGVDWQLQRTAIERATQLLLDIVGGQAGPVSEVVSEQTLPTLAVIELRSSRIQRVLGFEMDGTLVEDILRRLGFVVESVSEGCWRCTSPSWRFDMAQEVDLIEELARIYGYNRLPVSRVRASLQLAPSREDSRSLGAIRRQLVARGFHEAITYSFVAPAMQQLFDPSIAPVELRNPISADLAVMRTSLIPGLAKALAHNVKRQNTRVRLFESGARFLPGEPLVQQPMMALAITGARLQESWSNSGEKLDFFDLKGEVEQLLSGAAGEFSYRAAKRAGLHDGQTAEIVLADRVVGVLGAIHPEAAKQLDLPANTFFAEFHLDVVLSAPLPVCEDISRFPETRRDIAVVVGSSVPAADVLAVVTSVAGASLEDLRIFDVYTGQGIEPNKKSLALGLTFRDRERTLDDSEISETMTQVVDSLKEKFSAELRG